MKTNILKNLCVLLLLFISPHIYSQSIVSGPGTGGASDLHGPAYTVNNAPRCSRSVCIYPSSILTGLEDLDFISSIEWDRANTGRGVVAGANFKVYLKNISATGFATSPNPNWNSLLEGAILVFDGDPANIFGDSAGFKKVNFPIPFQYRTENGTHLAVITEYTQTVAATANIYWTQDAFQALDPSTPKQVRYYTQLSGTTLRCDTILRSFGGTINPLPRIRINYTKPVVCSGVTPGIAQASEISICPRREIFLTNIGVNHSLGIEYQWQSSADNLNWTDLPHDSLGFRTGNKISLIPVSTAYYRCKVKCNTDSAYSGSVRVEVNSSPPLGGIYTINKSQSTGGRNYNSFSEAVADLHCLGISSSVNFLVDKNHGPYVEKIVIGEINGASALNTIKFSGNGAKIMRNSTQLDQNIIEIIGTDYLTLEDLSIEMQAGSIGSAIQIQPQSNFNTFRRCHIIATDVAGISFANPIQKSSEFNHVIIENCIIEGGDCGIRFNGDTTKAGNSLSNYILNNKIKDFKQKGMWIWGARKVVISDNEIFRTYNATSAFSGIAITASNGAIVEKNRMHSPLGPKGAQLRFNCYGIEIASCYARKGTFIVRNNLVSNFNGSAVIAGLYHASGDSILFYNNTILLDGPDGVNVWGYISTGLVRGAELFNNLFYITKNVSNRKVILQWGNTASTFESNYNSFYLIGTGNTDFAYYGNASDNFSEWKLKGFDLNSVDVEPVFRNKALMNLDVVSPEVDGKGIYLPLVSDDIRGRPRSLTNADIGAFESTRYPDDVQLMEMVYNEVPCEGPFNLKLKAVNYGTDTLKNFTIRWTVNDTLQTDFNFNGTLLPLDETLVNIASYPLAQRNKYNFKFYSLNPNGSPEVDPSDDTLKVSEIKTKLKGDYTLGGTSSAYPDFTTLLDDLDKFGICGELRINVDSASGPYPEHIDLKMFEGLSADSRIIFNGNGAELTYQDFDEEKSVIRLNNAAYFNIENFYIPIYKAGNIYGIGIELEGNSHHNIIRNNHVRSSLSTVMYNQTNGLNRTNTGISLASWENPQLNKTSHNIVENNLVEGGIIGISVSGGDSLSKENIIQNNIIRNSEYTHISLVSSDKTIVSGNDISRPDRTPSSVFMGIKVATSSNFILEKNRIHHPNSMNANAVMQAYGIYLSDNLKPNKKWIRNNLIYKFDGIGPFSGIFITTSDSLMIVNNSIILDHDVYGNDMTGIEMSQNSKGIFLRNNMISLNREGSSLGKRVGLNFPCTNCTFTSDYNNIYLTGSGVKSFGVFKSLNYSTQADWIMATNNDVNTTVVFPDFVYSAFDNYKPFSSLLNNTGILIPEITDDIEGTLRSTSNSDVGAYEFSKLTDDISITKIISTNQQVNCLENDSVVFEIRNLSAEMKTGFKLKALITIPDSIYFEKIYTEHLESGARDTVVLKYVNPKKYNPYSLKLFAELANDELPGNDTLSKNFEAMPYPVIQLNLDTSDCFLKTIFLKVNGASSYQWSTGETSDSIVVSSSGMYKVLVTNDKGCTSEDSIYIYIPDFFAGWSSDTIVCEGDQVLLNVTHPASAYLWSTGDTSISILVNNTGTYSVIITDDKGCRDSASVFVKFEPIPSSNFSTFVTPDWVFQFEAEAIGGVFYSWDFGDPGSPDNTSVIRSPSHRYKNPGSYTVTLEVKSFHGLCTSVSKDTVDMIVGINDSRLSANMLSAYPNPFSGNSSIRYYINDRDDVSLEVFDMLGRKQETLIWNQKQDPGMHEYQFKGKYSPGIYLLKLTVKGVSSVIRLVEID